MKLPLEATFAVGNDGRMVHVSEVVRGRACMCLCAGCGVPVIAKQGALKAWHFAHDSFASCSTAAETALHLAIKQLIAEGDVISVPELKVEATATHNGHTGSVVRTLDRMRVLYSNPRLEVHLGDIVADAVVEAAGREMIVEVAVTHYVDEHKLSKIASLGLSALELQASKLTRNADWNQLRAFVRDSYADRVWLYHAREPLQRQLAQMDAHTQAKAMARRSAALQSFESVAAVHPPTASHAELPDSAVTEKFRCLWQKYNRGALGHVTLDGIAKRYVARWSEADANGDPYVYFNELLDWIRTRTSSTIEEN